MILDDKMSTKDDPGQYSVNSLFAQTENEVY